MKKLWFRILFCFLLGIGIISQGCTSLKPYERVYVNDLEMQMGLDAGQGFQHYTYSIREGAIAAGTVKGSGGCGCN